MAKKLIFILLFLLLVLTVIFGGYFISIKNTKEKIQDKIFSSIKNYEFSEPVVVSNNNFYYKKNSDEKIDMEEKLEDSENYDEKSYRNRSIECYEDADCGEDYDEKSYCVFNKVYKKVHEYSCDGQCSKKVKNIFVEECLMGCSDGKCIDSFPFKCSLDYDCGFNDFTGERYCFSDNNIHQKFIMWTCENPDSENSRCKIDISDKLVDECLDNLKCNMGMCVE